jgi:hypothetical protein
MNTTQKFASSFSIVLVSSVVSALLVLQNDLQACTNPAPNIVAESCTVHWQLLAAAFITAIISGAIHALQSHLAAQQAQITDLQAVTPLIPAPPGLSVSAPAGSFVTVDSQEAAGTLSQQATTSHTPSKENP